MMKISGAIDFNAPVSDYARKDFPLLEADATVDKALETIHGCSRSPIFLRPCFTSRAPGWSCNDPRES
jgi:hypothetical protein